MHRPNLHYSLDYNLSENERDDKIITLLKTKYSGQSGIIYCGKIEQTHYFNQLLQLNNISSAQYHAKLSAREKKLAFTGWRNNQILVLCSTIALGMGVDKRVTRFVINTEMSNSLVNYCQESGRVGRDNQAAVCILFYCYKQFMEKFNLIARNVGYNADAKKDFLNRLIDMLFYFENLRQCRYKLLITYLNYAAAEATDPNWKCHNCDIC